MENSEKTVITFLTLIILLSGSFICLDLRVCHGESFTDSFDNLDKSQWNFIFEAENGVLNCNSGLLNIVASPLFQDKPESAMIMRKWVTPNNDTFAISTR